MNSNSDWHRCDVHGDDGDDHDYEDDGDNDPKVMHTKVSTPIGRKGVGKCIICIICMRASGQDQSLDPPPHILAANLLEMKMQNFTSPFLEIKRANQHFLFFSRSINQFALKSSKNI